MYENKKVLINALLQQLLPVSEKSLLKTYQLLNETKTDINDFREYFYKYISEDLEFINIKEGITGIFYWFALDKASKCFSDYFANLLTDNIIVEDDVEPPLFRLTDKLKENELKRFFDDLIFILKVMPEENKTPIFNWFIKQLFIDVLNREYIFHKNEIYPNTIQKFQRGELELFKINHRKVSKIINQNNIEQLEIF